MKRSIPLHPSTWAGLSPNGVGKQKPNHVREMVKVAWDNKHNLKYAYDVLSKGVCDGCALGVAGFHDWTIDGIHLCTTRLKMLEFNTALPFDPKILADVAAYETMSTAELRALGRIGHPMRRRRGDRGFTRISWDEALRATGEAIGAADRERVAWYLTSRGLTNETYYVAGKAARSLGIANIDSAARVCHAPSTVGLKSTIGVAAATCSLTDVIESDLVILWGTNPANNQPVMMKYLDKAVKSGTKVVVVNPYLEPGLERYWVPSAPESYVFGTKITTLHVPVQPGGDVALSNAVLKQLIGRGAIDEDFIANNTEGFEALKAELETQTLDELVAAAGVSSSQLEDFVALIAEADTMVTIWSMGITQHRNGVEGVQALVNLNLSQGAVGRDGCGLMPIRGHSGVQGGAEMGAYATALAGGRTVDEANATELQELWGFPVPSTPGITAPEMIDAAADGDLDVLWCSGGNMTEVMADPSGTTEALAKVPLRVHADVVMTPQMFIEGDDVIVVPVRTRYEQEGGGTSTTTERRVAFSPEIPRTVGEARSEWRLYADLVGATEPSLAPHFAWDTNADLRAEIAAVIPSYAGIEDLAETGDAIQWGGRHLCAAGDFPTPSGKGGFTALRPEPARERIRGEFQVATRRGKQFNTIIWAETDPLTGASRDAVYIDHSDASGLGVVEGDAIKLTSPYGEMIGTAKTVDLAAGSLQVHWPEGNALLPTGRDDRELHSKIPDYNATVTLTRL